MSKPPPRSITIAELRSRLGLTLAGLAEQLGLAGLGNISAMERENRAALKPALRLEEIAAANGLLLDAATICDDVRLARAACLGGCEAVSAVHEAGDSPPPAAASTGKARANSRAAAQDVAA